MTETKEFDLASLSVRIVECARCHEPVLGERAAGRMTLHCGYCGFEDERELSSRRVPEEQRTAYRGKPRNTQGRLIKIDLDERPEGLRRVSGRAELKKLWREAKESIGTAVDDERSDAEYRLLWLGTSLATQQARARDFLRARATLETLLELVTLPPYKALTITRLARLAVLSNAPDLADKWLSVAPRDLRIPEITSDLRVTEAMIARARGDEKEMLEIIGRGDTAFEFVGGARWLALALRVDAHEREDDLALAARVWRDATRAAQGVKTTLPLDEVARSYDLAPRTRRRALTFGIAGLVGVLMLAYGLVVLVRGMFLHDTLSYVPLGLMGVGMVLAMLLKKV